MKTRRLVVLGFAAALAMLPAVARAQSASAIAGVVKDTSGAVMPRAGVSCARA